MKVILDIIRVIILSIVEGVTEFLPVSSTGHLILVNEFVKLEPQSFSNAFNVIIQLGAIISVIVVYFTRLNPFTIKKMKKKEIPSNYEEMNFQSKFVFLVKNYDKETISLWGKVIVGLIPAGVLGLLFDDLIDHYLMTPMVVASTLLIYGIIIILIEKRNEGKKNFKIESTEELDYRTAFMIGLFQCLAMVPGTSRSAATIIGGMILGLNRKAAADFSFFLAIPTMIGATLLKVVKNLGTFTFYQWMLIGLGFVLSFIVAYFVIKKFLSYIQKNDFKVFGYYRIVLSILVFIYFLFIK